MHVLHRTLWCAVVACGWLNTSAEDSSTPEPTAQVTTQTPWRAGVTFYPTESGGQEDCTVNTTGLQERFNQYTDTNCARMVRWNPWSGANPNSGALYALCPHCMCCQRGAFSIDGHCRAINGTHDVHWNGVCDDSYTAAMFWTVAGASIFTAIGAVLAYKAVMCFRRRGTAASRPDAYPLDGGTAAEKPLLGSGGPGASAAGAVGAVGAMEHGKTRFFHLAKGENPLRTPPPAHL